MGLKFLIEVQPNVRPSLFLNDKGNLRALWRNTDQKQVGLQFLGDENVQFVIFKCRLGRNRMARVAGTDTKSNIMTLIKTIGASGLLIS